MFIFFSLHSRLSVGFNHAIISFLFLHFQQYAIKFLVQSDCFIFPAAVKKIDFKLKQKKSKASLLLQMEIKIMSISLMKDYKKWNTNLITHFFYKNTKISLRVKYFQKPFTKKKEWNIFDIFLYSGISPSLFNNQQFKS